MQHLRKDYDAIQPWPVKRPHIAKVNGQTRAVELTDDPLEDTLQPVIPDDEPVFVLRGKDAASPVAVRVWAADTARRGGDAELVARVEAWADQMEAYAQLHNPDYTVADVPEGMLRG